MATDHAIPTQGTIVHELIDQLKHVIIIQDGTIIKNTVKDDKITIRLEDNQTFIKTFESDHPIVSKNQKEATCRLHIHVPKHHQSPHPLHIFFLQKDTDLKHNISLEIEAGAFLTYNEYLHAQKDVTIDVVSQALVAHSAILEYHGIANFDHNTVSSIHRIARAHDNARVLYKTAQMGHGNTHQDTWINLLGPMAYGEIKTVALANDAQEAIIKSLIEHSAKHTEGLIEQYGVAADTSFLVFEGVGKIHKGMKQSHAHQHNKGVVLGPLARLDANPLLLIDEYDVEASHGAAIGRIDEEQLYYLMSRGLSEKDAQRLIIKGYLAPLETLMKNDDMKEHFQRLLQQKTQ